VSQLETWDPHPGSTIGGPTRSIATSVKGIEIAEDRKLFSVMWQTRSRERASH